MTHNTLYIINVNVNDSIVCPMLKIISFFPAVKGSRGCDAKSGNFHLRRSHKSMGHKLSSALFDRISFKRHLNVNKGEMFP